MILKIISIILLITPLLHLLSLYYFRDKYYTNAVKLILYIAFGVSLILFAFKIKDALVLTICSLIAIFLSIGVEKVYMLILNAVLTPVIESISNAKVMSSIYATKNKAFAITSKGYITIQYKEQKYELYQSIDEASPVDQVILAKLKR